MTSLYNYTTRCYLKGKCSFIFWTSPNFTLYVVIIIVNVNDKLEIPGDKNNIKKFAKLNI